MGSVSRIGLAMVNRLPVRASVHGRDIGSSSNPINPSPF